MQRTAFVVGASGTGGRYVARELITNGWAVYGLARHPRQDEPGLKLVATDLPEPASLTTALLK